MIKRALILILFLYLLILLETSFFAHFVLLKWLPNTVLLTVIIYNLLENPKKKFGIYFALTAGFLLDVFSTKIIGFYMLILLIVTLLLKFIFKHYVRLPLEKT